MNIARRDADETRDLLESAGVEFGLALLGAMSTSLAMTVAIATVGAGRAFASGVESASVQAEIASIRRYVFGLGRRLREAHGWSDDRVQEYLRHPATLRLLAEARDDYAVAQMSANLARLATTGANFPVSPAADPTTKAGTRSRPWRQVIPP